MRKSTFSALISIFLVALFLRLWPVTRFLYWGADVGEYYGLSHYLLVHGRMPLDYWGWGFAYPDFPGMELLVSATSALGCPLLWAIALLVPIISSFIVLLIFLISNELFMDERVGLVSAGFIAVVMPHVYPTSHTMPGSIGDLLFVFCLLLFIRSLRDRKNLYILIPATFALVFTHHLSTYFLIICILFGLLLRGVLSKKAHWQFSKLELSYLCFLSFLSFSYWLILAPNFRRGILLKENLLTSPLFILGAGILAFLYLLVILWKRKNGHSFRPRFPGRIYLVSRVLLVLGLVSSIMLINILVEVPGTTISLPQISFFYFLPLVFLVSVSGAGTKTAYFFRNGFYPFAWFLAIALSTLFGIFSSSHILIPYRHMEYIMLPLALLAGLGTVRLYDSLPKNGGGWKALAVSSLVVLLIANAMVAYPSREFLAGCEEGTKDEGMKGILWSSAYIGGLTLADHRVSSALFGFGKVNATWDVAGKALHANSFEEAKEDMISVPSPSGTKRIEYAYLDEDIVKGAFLYPWDPSRPLSKEAVEKFAGDHYLKMYDDGYGSAFLVLWQER